MELGGGGWSWVEVEMCWMEVDGAGWRWVHDLAIPFNYYNSIYKNFNSLLNVLFVYI